MGYKSWVHVLGWQEMRWCLASPCHTPMCASIQGKRRRRRENTAAHLLRIFCAIQQLLPVAVSATARTRPSHTRVRTSTQGPVFGSMQIHFQNQNVLVYMHSCLVLFFWVFLVDCVDLWSWMLVPTAPWPLGFRVRGEGLGSG